MNEAPRDQGIRDRALDPTASFHLTAPAGSGKTAVLLARFLTLLAQVQESPREVLTLTFTRKAAGEFRARAMKYFWGQEPGESDPPAHERLLLDLAAEVLRHLDRKNLVHSYLGVPERLPVTTFHAFCAQLLKAAPHEAGVPLDFQLLEGDGEAEWLQQEALEELRRRLAGRPEAYPVRQALVRRLVRLNNNWRRLSEELRSLLARRDTLKDFLTLAHKSLAQESYAALMDERLSRVVAHVLEPLARMLRESELGRRWPEFVAALRRQGASLGKGLPEHPPQAHRDEAPAWQHLAQVLLTKGGDLRKQWLAKEGFPPRFADTPWPGIFRDLPEEFVSLLKRYRHLPREVFTEQEVAALHDLILLLHAAWEVYEELCRQRRVLDFIAVEEAALRLLQEESPGDLLLRLDWRLRHLLVDEFQDTSDNQTALLCRLLEGWSAGDGRTLTVVGDPKQSIYGWRQARLSIFLDSREGLRCTGGRTFPLTPLSLITNFRATATLITWVNQVFGGTIMGNPRVAGGFVFEAACPRPGREGGEAPVLALFTGEDREEARSREAAWLAHQVALAQNDLQDRGKMALLLFARTHIAFYLSALQEAGLVPKVREGLKLGDSQVVQHLHNLGRALVRPQDDVAWATVLTGPWTQPDLAVLAGVAQTPGKVWPEKLAVFAGSSPCPPALASLAARLLAAFERVGREPLVDTLERLLADVGAWRGLAAWEGALGVASARTYLRLLQEGEAGLPEATWERADFILEGAYQPPDPRAEDSPLEVLTIHGAKGLEFHTVFLPYLDWQPLLLGGNQPAPFLLEEIPGGGSHVLAMAPPYWQKGKDTAYRLVQNLKDARVLAEARRVFYVALTRAQERLVLSGVMTARQDSWTAPPESPLGWLWRHYRPGDLLPGATLTWENPPLRVEVFPEPPPLAGLPTTSPELSPAWEVIPERPLYVMSFPSQEAAAEAEERFPSPESVVDADNLVARARGEVTHRLLETLARGGGSPGEAGVAAALVELGVPRQEAQTLASEILSEAAACLQDPFLKKLLAAESSRFEWLLEDQPAPGFIRRGRLDLLAFDGKDWWLVDFKTSRPPLGVPWEDFLLSEKEKYRPQLEAYREITAKACRLKPEALRLALYFTACQKVLPL